MSAQMLDYVRRELQGEQVTQETSGMGAREWREIRGEAALVMETTPPYVIKYFTEEDAQYYERGQFKFGALRSYRGNEATASEKAARFYDTTEGLGRVRYDLLTLGCKFYAPGFKADGRGILILDSEAEVDWDFHVFCTSIGPYSRKHHRRMLAGGPALGGEYYSGNEKLTHYCMIDVGRFRAAVEEFRSAECKQRGDACLGADFVTYSGEKVFSWPPGRWETPESISETNRMVEEMVAYTKPEYFSVENEIRFIVKKNELSLQECVKITEAATFLSSEKLRLSIDEFGSIDNIA